jgi:hypothetical protein
MVIGDHEIDGNAGRREPASRLQVDEVAVKARGGHRVVQQGVVDEGTGVDR